MRCTPIIIPKNAVKAFKTECLFGNSDALVMYGERADGHCVEELFPFEKSRPVQDSLKATLTKPVSVALEQLEQDRFTTSSPVSTLLLVAWYGVPAPTHVFELPVSTMSVYVVGGVPTLTSTV